jgi:uncharacterized membrane protein
MTDEPDQSTHPPQPAPAGPPIQDDLAARVDRLEAEVAQLRAIVSQNAPVPGRSHIAGAPAAPVQQHFKPQGALPAPTAPADSPSTSAETWITRFGVLMLVLGVGFVVRYTAELGWWTATSKFAANLLLGTAMLAGGWLLRRARPGWSTLVAGAGYAILHISFVGGFRFWQLFDEPIAMAGVALVAVTSIIDTHLRDNDAPVAVGLSGAWLAPFVLADWQGPSSSGGWFLVLFFALSAASWWKRGSQSLLILHVLAGLSAAAVMLDVDDARLSTGVMFAIHLLLVSVVAPVRRAASINDPTPSLGLLGPLIAILSWLGLMEVMDVLERSEIVGPAAAVTAILFAGVHNLLSRKSPGRTESAATSAFLFAGVAMLGGLPEEFALLAAAAGCLAAAGLTGRLPGTSGIEFIGHVLAALMTGVLAWRWGQTSPDSPLPMLDIIVDLTTIGCFATTGLIRRAGAGPYLGLAFILAVVGTGAVLTPMPSGPPIVTAIWIGLAAVSIVVSVRRTSVVARWLGIATLAMAVGKLLVFDLQELSPLLRIVIFMATGSLLVALGFVIPRLVPTNAATSEQNPSAGP